MQTLLYSYHIVANIFAFYSLSPSRFPTITKYYLGGAADPQLNESLFQATLLYSSYVHQYLNKRRSHYEYMNEALQAENFIVSEFHLFEQNSTRSQIYDGRKLLKITASSGLSFNAILDPIRFSHLRELRVDNWTESLAGMKFALGDLTIDGICSAQG